MKAKKKYVPLDADVELKKLGARIKQLRIQKGYTNMDKFAYDHDINRTQYAQYELGKDLRYSSLIRLLNAFEITFDELFSLEV